MTKKHYWIWYWSSLEVINDPEDLRECKIFFDYEEMKRYSANHSKLHKSFHSGYWSSYDKVETYTTVLRIKDKQ